jgi:hypothetical protein
LPLPVYGVVFDPRSPGNVAGNVDGLAKRPVNASWSET